MGTSQPIRDKEDLLIFKDYYLKDEPDERNYALIVVGLNSALRISDLLHLKWQDVYLFENKEFKRHLYLIEQKTGKPQAIALNAHAVNALQSLLYKYENPTPESYVFSSTDGAAPLSRCSAFRIIKRAASNLSENEHISCHTLRKTFGYHAWKNGVHPAVLMEIYNHSSFKITRRYLGIEQKDKDEVFLTMNL